jgi:hypothetical protein
MLQRDSKHGLHVRSLDGQPVNWTVAVKTERQVCKSLALRTGQAMDAVPVQWAINIFIYFYYVLSLIL